MNIYLHQLKLPFLSLRGDLYILFFCFLLFSLLILMPDSLISHPGCEGKIIKEINLVGLKRIKEIIVTRELISKVGEPCKQKNPDDEYSRPEIG